MKIFVALPLMLMGAGVFGLDRQNIYSEKENIQRLAVERIRSAPMDYEKVMVAAEKRMRAMHGDSEDGGGKALPVLENDLRQLRGACQKMQRNATVGKAPAEDPVARALIDQIWSRYRAEIKLLRTRPLEISASSIDGEEDIRRVDVPGGERPRGERLENERFLSESQVYWQTMGAFRGLKERTVLELLYNTPHGERGLNEAFLRDEAALLKACEITAKKTRGASVRVVVPQEHVLKADPDVQTFYRSLDLVPDARPIRSGGFSVPVGARTVTLREDKAKMVFRPRRGKGVAYLGQSEAEIQYGYVAIPPDTAYYFENIGSEPLDLEYVGIKP